MHDSEIIINFIEQIWNGGHFDRLDNFLHTDFKDYSLPQGFPADKNGLIKWLTATGNAFKHYTVIEEVIASGEKCVLRITMQMKHIGVWRGIEATGAEVHARGYRQFLLCGDKIIEHRALIDGQEIERQLTGMLHNCNITETV